MDYIYNVRLIFMMSLRIGGHVSSTYVEWYSIYSGRVENMIGGSREFLSWECLPLFFISSSSSYTTSFYVTRILFLLLPFRNGHWTATNMLLFFCHDPREYEGRSWNLGIRAMGTGAPFLFFRLFLSQCGR